MKEAPEELVVGRVDLRVIWMTPSQEKSHTTEFQQEALNTT